MIIFYTKIDNNRWEYSSADELENLCWEDSANIPDDDELIRSIYIDDTKILLSRFLGRDAKFIDLIKLLGIV